MSVWTILAACVAVFGLFITLGTIIFRLGVANQKLETLTAAVNQLTGTVTTLTGDLNKLKFKLAGKIEGVTID